MRGYRKNRGHRSPASAARPLLVAALMLGLVATGAAVWWNRASPPASAGTPRLALDRDLIDLGNARFRVPVSAVFNVTNAGDGVLRLAASRVEVVSGC